MSRYTEQEVKRSQLEYHRDEHAHARIDALQVVLIKMFAELPGQPETLFRGQFKDLDRAGAKKVGWIP